MQIRKCDAYTELPAAFKYRRKSSFTDFHLVYFCLLKQQACFFVGYLFKKIGKGFFRTVCHAVLQTLSKCIPMCGSFSFSSRGLRWFQDELELFESE